MPGLKAPGHTPSRASRAEEGKHTPLVRGGGTRRITVGIKTMRTYIRDIHRQFSGSEPVRKMLRKRTRAPSGCVVPPPPPPSLPLLSLSPLQAGVAVIDAEGPAQGGGGPSCFTQSSFGVGGGVQLLYSSVWRGVMDAPKCVRFGRSRDPESNNEGRAFPRTRAFPRDPASPHEPHQCTGPLTEQGRNSRAGLSTPKIVPIPEDHFSSS